MYKLKISTAADADFAYQTVKTTMRDFAIQTWGTWLDEESRLAAIQDTELGKIQIVYMGDEKAGILQSQQLETEILIKQIYLLPLFQKRGIGTEIIRDFKTRSVELNIPIKLRVLRVNSALGVCAVEVRVARTR